MVGYSPPPGLRSLSPERRCNVDLKTIRKLRSPPPAQHKGLDARELPLFAAKGEVFSLDIPFYRTRHVARDLNNLGLLLKEKGDYAGAEPLYRRALAIDEKALGPDHPDVAIDLNNLAVLLKTKGDYAGAEPLYRRALATNEKVLGPDNPEVAMNVNNLAVLLDDKGDYVAAEPLYRRALAIDQKVLGPEHAL